MTFTFLVLLFAAVVLYILWVLFKPRKPVKKKIRKKTTPALKRKDKKEQATLRSADQTRKKRTEQMKKDPEIVSRVVRYWLNEK